MAGIRITEKKNMNNTIFSDKEYAELREKFILSVNNRFCNSCKFYGCQDYLDKPRREWCKSGKEITKNKSCEFHSINQEMNTMFEEPFKIPDILKGTELKLFAYAVYHIDTGKPAKPTDIKLSNGSTLFDDLDEFVLDNHGNLGVCPYDAEQWRTGFVDVKKEGKYIIRFTDGRYMRY